MSSSTKPSSSSGYDERFVVPLEASRRGAHRARVSPILAILPVAAVVGIVVGAIALVYFFLGGGSGADTGTVAAGPSTSAPAQSAPSAVTSSSSAASTMSPGTIDKTIKLDVYNGTSPTVSGVGRKAATKLTTGGWTTGTVSTWTGSAVLETTVYYASTEQKATAQAVVKTLGYGVAKLSPARAGDGIVVVVANDFVGGQVTRPTGESTTRTSSTAHSSSTPPSSSGPTGTTSSGSTTKSGSSTSSTKSTKPSTKSPSPTA